MTLKIISGAMRTGRRNKTNIRPQCKNRFKILAWIWKVNNLLTHLVRRFFNCDSWLTPWLVTQTRRCDVSEAYLCVLPSLLSLSGLFCVHTPGSPSADSHSCTVALRSIRSLYLNHPNAPQTHLPHCTVIVVRLWKYLLSCCCSLSWLLLVEYMEMGH